MTREEAIEVIKAWDFLDNDERKEALETLIPELKESEDELTWLTRFIEEEAYSLSMDIRDNEDRIKLKNLQRSLEWLKKQGEQKPKKVSIWKHWKNGIAGNAEGEQIFLIRIGNVYSISSCLGYECDYIELSELDKFMREEKQEKPKWTEEDEKNYRDIIGVIHSVTYQTYEDEVARISWLKSIKQRLEKQQ